MESSQVLMKEVFNSNERHTWTDAGCNEAAITTTLKSSLILHDASAVSMRSICTYNLVNSKAPMSLGLFPQFVA